MTVLYVLLAEVAIVLVVFIVLRLLRGKIRFFRGGYIKQVDSYMQDDKMKILVEDTHYRRGAVRNNRRIRVDGGNLVYSMIPLDKENKALLVYGYCAPLLAMVKGVGVPIERALVLGGGGGAVPLYILQNYDKSRVDTVEINADSIRMSEKYFLQDYVGDGGRARMILDDAKNAVKTLDGPYQFIFCDLYIGGQPADAMYEESFMKDVSRLAGETGLLVINAGSFSMEGVRVVLRNLLKAFDYAWAMMVSDGFVLMARNHVMPGLDNLLRHGNGVIGLYPNDLMKEALLSEEKPQAVQ